MRSSGNPFQVAIARQTKIETFGDFLPLNEHQRQLVLRLPCDRRIPEKDFVDCAVIQEIAGN